MSNWYGVHLGTCPEIITGLGANHSHQELLADIVGATSTVYSYHC